MHPDAAVQQQICPPQNRKQLESHGMPFHHMGQALSLLIACDLGAGLGHAAVLVAAQQLLQQADCGQMYSCNARQEFGAKARHALVFCVCFSVSRVSISLY